MAKNGMLTAAQKRAIAALLTERDTRTASRVSNVPERTLWRWLRENPTFQEELNRRESEMLGEASRRLLSMQVSALDVFQDVMSDPAAKDSDRLRAAEGASEFLIRLRDIYKVESWIRQLEEGGNNANG
jgi:hypothetical protein